MIPESVKSQVLNDFNEANGNISCKELAVKYELSIPAISTIISNGLLSKKI